MGLRWLVARFRAKVIHLDSLQGCRAPGFSLQVEEGTIVRCGLTLAGERVRISMVAHFVTSVGFVRFWKLPLNAYTLQ